jgi:hypothetical protein
MLKAGEPLYIAEGCSDCWSLLSAGHKAIAIPSATLLKKEDIAAIIQHIPPDTRLFMYPDQDEAGLRLFQQLESMLESSFCRRDSLCASGSLPTGEGGGRGRLSRLPLPSGCKDFSDYYCSINSKHSKI